MKYPVRLFLGNEEVEFSTPPEILFNYSETELTNPTIVKNSYSKTITIEGTPQNNRIFGHIYNMERLQAYNGTMTGSSFNPLVKTDFTLYYNGSIYESGYFKLEEIRRNDNNIEYDIVLYGGLGDFFYNLSFREDGNPMELSDLLFSCETWGDNIGFTINKETVADAWEYSWHTGDKWGTINFAPCYNGIPDNFGADKVLINNSGITEYQSSTIGGTYRNYSVGILNEEITEWEAFDLRSYLQRPVVRVLEVIGACCDPQNNGGYTVNLDPDFFNSNNNYYFDAWMTLKMLHELNVPATVSSALTVTSITQEETFLYKVYEGLGNTTNVSFDMGLKFTPSDGYSGDSVYLLRDYTANGGATLQSRFVKSMQVDSFYMLQLLGYNGTGQIAAYSDMYRLITPPEGDYIVKDITWQKDEFEKTSPKTTVNNITTLVGKFTKINGEYVWTDMDGNVRNLSFTFPSDSEFTQIKVKIVPYRVYKRSNTWQGGSQIVEGNYPEFWSKVHTHSNVWQDQSTVENLNKVRGTVSYIPVGATGTTTSFEGFYSGRQYTKKDLLTLGVTPAQFLLSYAKMFGLYFVKDVETKTIDILTRHNFYERDKIVNINDLVDKGSDITIVPNSPKYQYYDFALEQVDSDAAGAYKKTYGNDYGTATVNTGYQYEREHKSLLDGNIFRGGINVLEKDKYFVKPVFGQTYYNGPVYVCNNFSWWYPIAGDGTDEDRRDTKPMTGATINPDGLAYYDAFPKPQFHNAENKPIDGSMVLLFYDLKKDVSNLGYHLTDDTLEMYTMNDGQPCWMMNRYTKDRAGNTVALDVSYIPSFTRDIYNDNYISNSFDLGSPLTTYVPNKYVSDWQSIYSKGWKSYISDLYDVNTRVLKCRCLLRERPNPEWLRRFYWFDNSYWRLNNIKDWNISSFNTTEMEFIKVQDIADYDNVEFSRFATIEWRLDAKYLGQVDDITVRYSIGSGATTVTGYIYDSDGTGFVIGQDGITAEYSDGSSEEYIASDIVNPTYARGASNVPVTLTIPANPSGLTRTFYITLEDNYDKWHNLELVQDAKEIERKNYLAMDIVSGGTIAWKKVGTEASKVIEYSKDEGENWSSITSNSGSVINVSAGDRVVFRGNNVRYGSPTNNGTTFSGGTAYFNLSGNIMSLIYGDDFEGQTTLVSANTFQFLFENTNVISASGLTLPATTLAEHSYRGMFLECTSLVDFPNLPATALTPYCYHSMFEGCTSLTSAPILHSTSLARNCYAYMFEGCTSLTTAPALPATTLASYCYDYMFDNCTSLTTAPVLSAATLVERCYQRMFNGCSSLNYVRCLATDISADNCTNNWLSGVAATGTFVKANETTWNRGTNGVPDGWTIVNDTPVPTWDCYMTLTYGDFTAPQNGMWDEYTIYYGSEQYPAQMGEHLLVYFGPGGIIMSQGDTWNPSVDATEWTVSSPFSENRAFDRINVPQPLAGTSFNLQVEFGSGDLGYAVYSAPVTVNVPQNGGNINVTIPAF